MQPVATSLTFNTVGVASKKSVQSLYLHRLLAKEDVKILSTRVLVGRLVAWHTWNRTSFRHQRKKKRKEQRTTS